MDQYVNHLFFYIKKAAKKKFVSFDRHPTNPTLTEEIDLLRLWLSPSSGIDWESQIHHILMRMAFANSVGDNCIYGGGGFSIKLTFWWHLIWPDKIQKRTSYSSTTTKKENSSRSMSLSIFPSSTTTALP